jgi:hypothetical protein
MEKTQKIIALKIRWLNEIMKIFSTMYCKVPENVCMFVPPTSKKLKLLTYLKQKTK